MFRVLVVFADPAKKPRKGLTNWERQDHSSSKRILTRNGNTLIKVLVWYPGFGRQWQAYEDWQIVPIA